MRPYHIQVNWIDYNATIEQDIYEVIILNRDNKDIITSWQTAAMNVGLTISKYMNGTKDAIDI